MIAGDLSKADGNLATSLSTRWSAFAYGNSMSDTSEFIYGNDTVYFAQPSLSQFLPGGYGAGALNQSALTSLNNATSNNLPLTGRNAPRSNTGVVLRYAPPNWRCSWGRPDLHFLFRYPQWGIRIHCEKLPDPQVNL